MSKDSPTFDASKIPETARVGIVAAKWNAKIVDELLRRCEARLIELGITNDRFESHRVPGAFELPVAAKMLIDAERVNAVICLGCVIRGDTPHFDYVAGEAARGIQNVATETGVPVIFGVLTTNNEQQSVDRLDNGARSAEAALEMIALSWSLKRPRR